jgi:GSH-dependent disulfide-bond oxidoreductase
MIRFYFHPSPNPLKVALFLEESELAYELVPVDTFKGEQHTQAFRSINPNAKVPAIIDGETTVFDSNAILLYLAEKTGFFLPAPQLRGELLSWLMFVATGLSPFSGQAVHFLHHAPEQLPYARNRYLREVERHYRVLDQHLAGAEYLIGGTYTIADMAAWGWLNFAPYVLGEKGLADYPNLKRLFDEISARPAAARVHEIKTRLTLKADLDAEARQALFPQNEQAVA